MVQRRSSISKVVAALPPPKINEKGDTQIFTGGSVITKEGVMLWRQGDHLPRSVWQPILIFTVPADCHESAGFMEGYNETI